MFEKEIIKILISNCFILNSVSLHNNVPAIFPYYIPPKVSKPYILFYTLNYNVPTKQETKILAIEYLNEDIDVTESLKYGIEIINSIDNLTLIEKGKGELRFYLSGNTEFLNNRLQVKFIIRGDLKSWGIV